MLAPWGPCGKWGVARRCFKHGLAAAGLACFVMGTISGAWGCWRHIQRAEKVAEQLLVMLDADISPIRQGRRAWQHAMHLGTAEFQGS